MKKLLLLILISGLFLFCQKNELKPAYSAQEIDSLITVFEQHIQKIESDFKTADWSPLTEEDKKTFNHLDYFSYDINWRFDSKLHVYPVQDSLVIRGSREGDLRPAVKHGYFEFEKGELNFQLQVIKILPKKPEGKAYLFLGFWDELSDQETYGGGRYINIEEQDKNLYTIDFNYAYNPYCAYSSRYSCAIPPFANRLKIAVTAGEKIFKDHE